MHDAPYGTWPSPLSPAVMGGARVSLAGLQVVGDTCWWSESRPHEGGRMAVMRRRRGGVPEEVTPAPVSARTRVHEYGGAAHWATEDGLLYRLRRPGPLVARPRGRPGPAHPRGTGRRDPPLRRRPPGGRGPIRGLSTRTSP